MGDIQSSEVKIHFISILTFEYYDTELFKVKILRIFVDQTSEKTSDNKGVGLSKFYF
jgi:hypothetical protein